MDEFRYYFSFGSNMSLWRISKNCPPDAPPPEFIDAARLDHYQLCFSGPDWPTWHGAPASITQSEGDVVWGVLWKVSTKHLICLDRQEGKMYEKKEMSVVTKAGHTIACYLYMMSEDNFKSLPSKPYLDIIVEGAREHDLPHEYIVYLEQLKHNGYVGSVNPP